MYDELAKRLREAAISADSGNEISESLYRDIMQAADAIEKLGDWWAMADKLVKMLEMPCWIPVTERLPEENAPCIVYNKYYGPMVGWRVDGERFRIPGSRFPDHPTHWMPLPQPPKEET
ncbi:MAG: DUF551 domain-containing protein [Oscillospiraceae bacterium]|nr:DUF551 domain-containing protein [Oscillospiraceae bacterium]